MAKIIGLRANPLAAVWWSTIGIVEQGKWSVMSASCVVADVFAFRLGSVEGFNTEMSDFSIRALEAAQP